MDYTASYLTAEELISDIPLGSESGRIRAITIYNAASYLLDDAVGAWYKRLLASDRFPSDAAGARLPWERMLFLVTRVPWIVPIYSTGEGIDLQIKRKLHLYYVPTHLIEKKSRGPSSDYGWRYGPPSPDMKLVGLAINIPGIAMDGPRLDFLSPSTMREVYGNARSSLMEMGATHTRNLPYAGFIRSPNMLLCPIGMNRLGSDWLLNVQGSIYHPSPIHRWLGRLVYNRKTMSVSKGLEPILLAGWTNAVDAQFAVEAIFYQIATMVSWTYLHQSIDLRSDPLPMTFPVSPVGDPFARLRRLLPLVVRAATKSRSDCAHDAMISFLLHSLEKVIKSKKIHLPKRIRGVEEAIRLFLTDEGIRKKVLADLAGVKSSAKYDPARVRKIRNLTEEVRIFVSLDDRKRALKRLKAELVFRDHFYWDKETDVRVLCEHEVALLENLSNGIVDPDAVVDKYSDQARIVGDNDSLSNKPNILECKYCREDLGSVWLTTSSLGDDSSTFVKKAVEGSFLDTEVGSFIIRLLSNQSLQTNAQPSTVTRIVHSISSIVMGAEYMKLSKSNARDRQLREMFLSLAATVSILNVLMQNGAPIGLNFSALEALLSKEYIETLQKLGLLPKSAIKFMLDYWPKTLSHYFANVKGTIHNAVIELSGLEMDKLLPQLYQRSLAYPVGLKSLRQADATKLATPSAKAYAVFVVRSTPLDRGKRRLFRPLALSSAQRDPRIYFPRPIVPIIRSAKIGKVESEATKESFGESVANVCPELLLHPVSGKEFYDRVSKERGVPILGIAAEKVSLESHLFSKERHACVWCAIESNLSVSDAYYAKYHRVIEDLEKNIPKYDFSCAGGKSMATKKKDDEGTTAATTIDTAINRDVAREFSRRFGWSIGPVSSITKELTYIVMAIGHYRLGQLLFDDKSKGQSSLLVTAWNIFMTWALKQKEEIALRSIFRLRAIHASAAAKV